MSRDETPDTTGLVHNHPPYRPVCNERLVDGQLRGACLASPNPAVVTPDAGDARCTCANDGHARRCPHHTQEDFDAAERTREGAPEAGDNIVQRIVNAWDCCGTCAGGVLANHVAAAREAHNESCATTDQWRDQKDRAEAAEERLAGLVAQIEALADEASESIHALSQSPEPRPTDFSVTKCIDADDLRALIPAAAATALDAVKAEVWDEGHCAGYEDRRSETQFIRFVSENPYRHTPEATS